MVNNLSKLNYYDVMDLSPDSADAETIKCRYLELRAFYGSPEIKKKGIFTDQELLGLQELLEEAYAVLGNQTLKAIYDEKLSMTGHQNFVPNAQAQRTHEGSLNEDKRDGKSQTGDGQVASETRFEPSAKVSKKSIWKLNYEKVEAEESWINSNQNWDGQALKRVREYKRVDINQLSQITKINPFYITAIESLEPKFLPAPVFVRGYILQISRFLSLNEQKVAESYMKAYQKACENKKDIDL
jgi:curved DNA-binding protein CbpA